MSHQKLVLTKPQSAPNFEQIDSRLAWGENSKQRFNGQA